MKYEAEYRPFSFFEHHHAIGREEACSRRNMLFTGLVALSLSRSPIALVGHGITANCLAPSHLTSQAPSSGCFQIRDCTRVLAGVSELVTISCRGSSLAEGSCVRQRMFAGRHLSHRSVGAAT